jgi:DDE superfamily endonuclease
MSENYAVFGPVRPPHCSSFSRRRRRQHGISALAAVFHMAALALHLEEADERAYLSFRRAAIRAAFRSEHMDRCDALVDTEWVCIFRMKRSSMEELRHILYPYLKVRLHDAIIQARHGGNRRPLSVDEKLGMGLMIAGGCTMGGILFSYHFSKSTAYKVFWKFCCAVVESRVGEIKFPCTLEELQKASDAFSTTSCNNHHFLGHIGALDGLAIRIPLPSVKDCDYPLSYMNRKGFPAINAQGIADANAKCIHLSMLTPGSTHDSTAWAITPLSVEWAANCMADPRTGRRFWISDDDAYGATCNQLCPWPGTGLRTRDPYKDSFNYHLSGGNRNVVERLFGQVYQRWGILWRPIRYPLAKVPVIVMAVFQLHNFFKDCTDDHLPSANTGAGQRGSDERLRSSRNAADGFDHEFHTQDQCAVEIVQRPRLRGGVCPIRDEITKALELDMVLRPLDTRLGTDMRDRIDL